MNKKIVGIFVCMLLIGTIIFSVNSVYACLGFTASDDDDVLVGCNADWSVDWNVFINFLPAEEGKYGRVVLDMWWPWFGDQDWFLPIQGMNDQGLFFDTYMTPERPAVYSGLPFFESDDPDYYDYALWAYCLAKCSTVYDVLDIITKYDQFCNNDIAAGQWFFADRNGDSVIIEDYEHILFKEGNFQVVTNFLHTKPELGCLMHAYERYNITVSMLENMTELNVDYFISICDTTHLASTIFSNAYDLLQEKMYVHYLKDYENRVEFDLNEELAMGKRRIYLGSFFEPEGNQNPGKPDAPTGNETGSPGEEYIYSVRKTIDPDNDKLSYMWDWGDGTFSYWIPTPRSVMYLSTNHNWSEEGTYEVRVKAMDQYGAESEWSEPLVVSMPKNKMKYQINNLFERLLYRFSLFEKILNQII